MPFDPQLVRPDDAPLHDSGDLALPDDLLELAAQLGDDAQHLAALYPPASLTRSVSEDRTISTRSVSEDRTISTRSVSEDRSPRYPRLRFGLVSPRLRFGLVLRTTALVASVAIIFVSASLWYSRDNAPQPPPRSIASGPDHTIETHSTPVADAQGSPPQSAISNPQSPISPSSPTAPPPVASPAMFLHEYSGPELEGLYDLLGDSEDDKISI